MNKIKHIKYKPIPVRDTLIEIKDVSELMLDLAYSAALFNNVQLAEEVIQLEKKIDDLQYQLNMNLMLITHNPKDAEALAGVQRVGSLANTISDAAGDIAKIVLKGLNVHPIAQKAFELTEEKLDLMFVSENSIIIGHTVDELHLARKIGADIIAIRRGQHWLINPGKEMIMPEDMIIARGTFSGLEVLKKASTGEIDIIE
ncbi:potassium channel protein [Candidatus Bathyarchaeota archaeon]|nr:potassium channel protein [Candidatus Bathyarchaeota archaeon]